MRGHCARPGFHAELAEARGVRREEANIYVLSGDGCGADAAGDALSEDSGASAGRVRMGAEGCGEHDDPVIALALACWRARRR